jgi:hypothetical protein
MTFATYSTAFYHSAQHKEERWRIILVWICIDLKLLTLPRKQFNIGPKAVRENLAL